MNAKAASPSNLWFAISMGLIGLIVGYGLATAVAPTGATTGGQVADAPTAPVPTAPAPTPTADDVNPVDVDEDHIRGDQGATISVIEYSDFECPFCQRHAPTMDQLLEQVDDVNLVYRHFPLSFHPNAQISAEASECAAEQGEFWAYHDLLFTKGAVQANLVGYAEELDLDTGDFQDCLDSGRYTQKVKDQMASGSAAGVNGTPGNIVINNETGETRLVSGAQPLSAFTAAIDALR